MKTKKRGEAMEPGKIQSRRGKAGALLMALGLAASVTAGATLAYLTEVSGPVTNRFAAAQVTCRVVETFTNQVKTNVKIQNTGNTHAYIRAAIVVTWKAGENGDVYGSLPKLGEDYLLTLNPAGDWFAADDGYYYYARPVEPGGNTAVLIQSCQPVAGKAPSGYGLNVEILSSAIQSDPKEAVNQAWNGVQAQTDGGVLAKKGGGRE